MSGDGTKAAIRSLRVTSGLTQEELARQLGVSLSTVCRWEQGRSRPSRLALASLEHLRARLAPPGGPLGVGSPVD